MNFHNSINLNSNILKLFKEKKILKSKNIKNICKKIILLHMIQSKIARKKI